MEQRKVILDCDPGHDDAFAMLMALASEKIELIGVTTSAGNQVPEKTFNNARKLLALAGREDIPVAMGAKKPLIRELIIADSVHGETGLDGADLPEPTVDPQKISANKLLYDILSKEDKVTLVATGPLTNLAIFILSHPELKDKIDMISFMGGAIFGGNYSPHAEFNIYVDPEAAKIVLDSGIPVAMFGLDVTLKAQIYQSDINEIRNLNNKVSTIMADLLDFFNLTTTYPFWAKQEHEEGVHMHDPCAMAYLIKPEIFDMYDMYVDIETSNTLSLGSTVVDYDNLYEKAPNAKVAYDLDLVEFKNIIFETLKYFG